MKSFYLVAGFCLVSIGAYGASPSSAPATAASAARKPAQWNGQAVPCSEDPRVIAIALLQAEADGISVPGADMNCLMPKDHPYVDTTTERQPLSGASPEPTLVDSKHPFFGLRLKTLPAPGGSATPFYASFRWKLAGKAETVADSISFYLNPARESSHSCAILFKRPKVPALKESCVGR